MEKPPVHHEDPDPLACAANWKVVYSPPQVAYGLKPTALRWNAGRLFTFLVSDPKPRIFTFPDSGGLPTTLYEGAVWNFWIEGQRLLFAGSGPSYMVGGASVSDTLLYSMPIGGGPAEVLVTSHIYTGDGGPLVTGWGLDAQALYWVQMRYGSTADNNIWTAWSGARDGGGDRNLGTLPVVMSGSLFFAMIEPVKDHLIVYNDQSLFTSTLSVRKDGGGVTVLPQWGQVLGVSRAGTVLFGRPTGQPNGEKRGDHYEVGRLLPGAAEVESFWPGKPPSAYPLSAWDDGSDGSYVSLWEWGIDDAIHLTMWIVGADGNGRRLACDPLVQSTISAAAVGPDGIYVIISYSNQYWEVAKISLSN